MGGKTKQSQRTKNNVRPSSSGRSAELLSNISGEFNALKLNVENGQLTLFPTLATIGLEQGLTVELQICIKKLNKKDPITKTKALQELCDLVKNNKVEDAVAVLPSWTHLYKVLTVNVDRKVREYTQACHGALMSVCGRQVAPHLKQLLPVWLQALHDDHAPAQSLAIKSLKNTFPDRKLPEVLSFCKSEVAAYLLDALTRNAENILTRKIEDAEEKALWHQRVVTSSLRGLEYFVSQLPRAHDDWLWETLSPLLQTSLYWKYPTNNFDQIRAAWFAVTARLIERFGSTFGDKFGAVTMKLLLAVHKESNYQVAANTWACLLQFMHSVEDWYTYLEKKELLSKRILNVLENGGWGDARHLSTLLLPLLAHLPPEDFGIDFYRSFFNAIYAGLKKKHILMSKSERQSWITSLGECLRYLSIQQHEFVAEVVVSVHRTWLEEVLCAQHDHQIKANLVKCSAANMATLVKYWLQRTNNENADKYELMIRNFWQNIGSTTSAQVDRLHADREEITELVEQHVLLFKTLKTSFLQNPKKQQSIKFEVDLEVPEKKVEESGLRCEETVCLRYKHNLDVLVHMICCKYFEFAYSQQVSEPVMSPLISLVTEFDAAALFSCVAKQFNADSVYDLYQNVLHGWLRADTMRCKSLVDIVFLMLRHMTQEEQTHTMDSFQQLSELCVEWCVSAAAVHPHRRLSAVRSWMRSAVPIRDCLAALCRRFVTTNCSSARSLILVCMHHDQHGEMLISEEAVAVIAQTLLEALLELQRDALEPAGSLGAALCCALGPEPLHRHCRQLLARLFLVNCHVPRGDPRLSLETWCEICSSWQDGIASFNKEQQLAFLLDLADDIQLLVSDISEGLNTSKLENITSLCPYLLSKDCNPPKDLELTSTFTRKLLSLKVESLESFALHHDCIFSNLNCPLEDDNENIKCILDDSQRELSKPDVVAFVNSVVFRSLYMKMLLHHKGDDEGDESWCQTLLANEQILLEMCKVMYDYSIVCSLCEGYTFWQHYPFLQDCKGQLERILKEIITEYSTESGILVMKKFSDVAASTGYYWSYARRYFEVMSGYNADAGEALDLSKLAEAVTGNGFFHSLQAMSKDSGDPDVVHRCRYLVMVRSFLAAHGPRLEPEMQRDLLMDPAACDPTSLINAYFKHNDTMLYETDIEEKPWREVVSTAAVLDFLTHLVEHRGWDAPAHCWDFTTISLCAVATSLAKSTRSWDSLKMGVLCRAACRLYVAVARFIGGVRAECERHQPSDHIACLPTEWTEVFAPDLQCSLLALITHVLESDCSHMNSNRAAVIEGLVRCTELMDWQLLPRVRQLDAFPLSMLMTACTSCADAASHLAYHFLAHSTLKMITDPMLLEDTEKLSSWHKQGEERDLERPKLSIELLDGAYQRLQERALTALAAADNNDAACPNQDECANQGVWCAGWLLLVDCVHRVVTRAADEPRQHLVRVCRERGYTGPLLSAALRLLPPDLLQLAHTPPPHYDHYFRTAPEYCLYEWSPALCARLACRGVWWAVSADGGAAARAWAAAAGPTASRTLAYLVRAYLSPHLVRHQLEHLQRHAHTIDDAEVVIRWSAREVACALTVEERRLELQLRLAEDHPLGAPTVSDPGAPGLNTAWIVVYLAHQNGTVLGALQLWVHAVSSRLERMPQCYICYCRLDHASGRLPSVRCFQCRNKYHSTCLNKWFDTSKKNNCPLCRKEFSKRN